MTRNSSRTSVRPEFQSRKALNTPYVSLGSTPEEPTSCVDFRYWGESRPPAGPTKRRFLAQEQMSTFGQSSFAKALKIMVAIRIIFEG